ncbi:hypothetical protein M1466_00760 [Candidatus Dependentiae bacterium]|nr:hypothetical protein [Candidatus Dependentiae bacterium]
MFILLVLLGSCMQLSADWSIIQQRELLQERLAPVALSAQFDCLFNNSDWRALFVERPKFSQLAVTVWRAMTVEERQAYEKKADEYTAVYRETYEPRWQSLVETLQVEDLARAVDNPVAGHAFTIYYPAVPGWLLKIPKHCMIDNQELRPGRWQNLSRVLYSAAIEQFIKQHQCQYAQVSRELLYPVPGVYEVGVSDASYWVLSAMIPDLPSVQDNMQRWQSLIDRSGEKPVVKPAAQELLREFVALTHAVGLWDHKPHNIFLRQCGDYYTFIAVDQEKPGLGGAPDSNFFHRDAAEVIRNAKVGLRDSLVHLLGFSREDLAEGLDMISSLFGYADWAAFEPVWDSATVTKDQETGKWLWQSAR